MARVAEIAETKGVTAGQLALAWVLAQGTDIVPIPGTTRRSHLTENIAAAQLVLKTGELAAISDAMPDDAICGERYPEAMMRMVNQ